MEIRIPEKVKKIIQKLEDNGFEAYAVGGCIRDSILKRVPDDWDITTRATPEEVKALFLHTIDTGIKHGTVTVMIGKEGYEVTTFRVDGDYSDGRHPDSISFTASLSEDLKRRDFTINAMAYSESTGLVDEFGGVKDLRERIVRCVGDPYERFGEDALRMLRAIRFAGQLGFEIEGGTYIAIKELSPAITKVSVERIAKEMEKLLLSKGVEKIKAVVKSDLLMHFMPELHRYLKAKPEETDRMISVMEGTVFPDEKGLHAIRLSVLLEPLGVDQAVKILRRLKLDNETIRMVKSLILGALIEPETDGRMMRRTANMFGKHFLPYLFSARRAKGMETGEELFREMMEKKHCTEISELKINGNDLMALGFPKGVGIGEELHRLLALVIEEPELNKREKLIAEVKRNEGE